MTKISENQSFSKVFRGYRKRQVAWNRLNIPVRKLRFFVASVVIHVTRRGHLTKKLLNAESFLAS